MKIAMLGLGAMGAAAAANLIAKGHEVRGVDLRQAALDALRAAGGKPAASIADAVAGADAIVTFVVNAAQVEAVTSGPEGVLARMEPGAVLIQCATVSAAFMARLGEQFVAAGRLLLDAPVSGGVSGAAGGGLTIMASGPRSFIIQLAAALQDDPPSNSTIDIFVKDLALVLDSGRDLKFPLPLAAAAHQMFLAGSAIGKGGVDDSHLWEAYPRPSAKPAAKSAS